MKNFFNKRKLKFDILTSFLIVQFLTAGFILSYSYINNRDALLEFSNKTMEALSINKIRIIGERLKNIEMSLNVGSYLITQSSDIDPKNLNFINYMMAVVTLQPYLESIYIGTNTHRFLQLRIMEKGSSYRSIPDKLLPHTTKYGLRVLDSQPHKSEIWTYLDDESRVVEREALPMGMINFDYKVREWYTKPHQINGPVWTNVFIFNSSRKAGVAYAYPLMGQNGQYFAVISTTIHLETFRELLKQNLKSGYMVVMNPKGEIMVHSEEIDIIRNKAGDVVLATTEDLKDKTLHNAFQLYNTQKQDQFPFTHNNVDYIATFKTMEGIANQDWIFATIIPMDTFVGRVKDIQKTTLIICFFILLLSIFFIIFIVKRIAQPIMTLAQQADHIRHFNLDVPLPVASGIYEIQTLEQSLITMRKSLNFFSKFVPKTLVQKLVDKTPEIKLGGKERRLTVLFSDVASFTTISESMTADKLMGHLSEYFDEMTQIVLAQSGTVDKYIGDSIMAFWGAPTTDRDHALHACEAALACQYKLVELNRKWIFQKKPELPTRMGIHTGDMVVGFLGSSERLNYTVLGDAVNLASRLEGVNKLFRTNIIMSDDTYQLVKDYAVVRPLDIVAVKGKTVGTKIYELMALSHSNPQLLPTSDDIAFCEGFTKAFDLFIDKRFDEALRAFEKIKELFEKDYVTQLYIDRCTRYIENPPGDAWTPVNHLDSK